MQCYACEKGKFAPSIGSKRCKPCNESLSEYSDVQSATRCKVCPVGDMSTGKSCIHQCSPGQYLNEDKLCTQCPAGAECNGGSQMIFGSVRAKFGWSRCNASVNGNLPRFGRCQFGAACQVRRTMPCVVSLRIWISVIWLQQLTIRPTVLRDVFQSKVT